MKPMELNRMALTPINDLEMTEINGGSSFWEDFLYAVEMTAKSISVFGKTAAEFQASLPSSLKK